MINRGKLTFLMERNQSDKSNVQTLASMLSSTTKSDRAVFLTQDEIPTSWYNIQADLPEPLPPPLDPGTLKPMSPEPFFRLFAKELVMQEVSQERWIKIPDKVMEAYRWLPRPTPLMRAFKLEEYLRLQRKSTTNGRDHTLQEATSRTQP